jgi:hypothetical protein
MLVNDRRLHLPACSVKTPNMPKTCKVLSGFEEDFGLLEVLEAAALSTDEISPFNREIRRAGSRPRGC